MGKEQPLWTHVEDKYISANYRRMTDSQIASHLGRKHHEVTMRRIILGYDKNKFREQDLSKPPGDPTPEEILAICVKIREGWTDGERRNRDARKRSPLVPRFSDLHIFQPEDYLIDP